ncbi:hypothetical protein GCM10010178_24920 [Lentzea flava]|uniref:Uncharacterized protein n=1 Tax=Lentzea flava TaxID=103732 RepID=A0ABQ2UGJ5_9PSEU|nr:hypothetical protein GCM10010178_24920 [Lentzea flava]
MPDTPNDEMPIRRGRSTAGHGVAEVSRDTEPADQSTWEDGEVTCRVRGSMPCRIACTALITDATPAAACVWPMFDLIEPM